MTSTVARPSHQAAAGRAGWRGGELLTARITRTGRIVVHQLIMASELDAYGRVTLYPTTTRETDLGRVGPDDRLAWAEAEAVLCSAGYRPAEDWTTIERLPAVRLRRITTTSRGTVPRGN